MLTDLMMMPTRLAGRNFWWISRPVLFEFIKHLDLPARPMFSLIFMTSVGVDNLSDAIIA